MQLHLQLMHLFSHHLINDFLKKSNNSAKIIAISKNHPLKSVLEAINAGVYIFGENRVQEAFEKWSNVKTNKIKLHLIGKLQTNKVKTAVKLFDFIHSLDSEKLANKISEEQKKVKNDLKLFIQINLADEKQTSGIEPKTAKPFYDYCKNNLNLKIIGTMCLPPFGEDPEPYFKKLSEINTSLNLKELSMGMSDDYLLALKYRSTYLRIGSKIFGRRN